MFLCPVCGASSVFTVHGDGDITHNELTKALIANLQQAQAKLAEGKNDEAHFHIESVINIMRTNVLETKP